VLAYQKDRKIATTVEGKLLDNEAERFRFYRELQAREILVYIDDDPTVSIYIIIHAIYLRINFSTGIG